MSSSTTRKVRAAARADGTDKKLVSARKEAEKKRKDKIKWTIISALIFLFIVAIIVLNSGAYYRSATAVSVDINAYEADGLSIPAEKDNFSIAQLNYLFRFNYSQFVNQYGSYASIFGLDTSKPIKSQACTMTGEENYTWYDYFLDAAKQQLQSYAAMGAYAKAAGITLDEEDQAAIEEAVQSLKDGSKENGYRSMNAFLNANYGKGCNEQVFRSILEMEYLSMSVQDTIMAEKTYSADDISKHYVEIADDYDYYSYDFYLVKAKTEEVAEGESAAAPTEEAMAAAKELADFMKEAAAQKGLQGAVNAVLDGTYVPLAQIETEELEIVGDPLVGGEAPVIAPAPDTAEEPTDIVPAPDAEGEDIVAPANDESAITEQVDVQGQSIESAIADWVKSADRVTGDIEVIEYAGVGYYVVIFNERHTDREATEETDNKPYCDYISEQLLRSEDLNAWNEAVFSKLMEGVTVTNKFGAKYIA